MLSILGLKEKNIVATIEKSGDIKILSQAEIRTRQDNLRALEKSIADMHTTFIFPMNFLSDYQKKHYREKYYCVN